MSEDTMSNPAQRRKLGRGMVLSIAGVLLCWVPVLGALLALFGLYSVISSYVPDCRVRYPVYVALSMTCALASVGALVGMAYVYFGNPELLSQIKSFIMTQLNIQ